ncbi:DUF3347 domain-containing protein [Aquimarina sp. AU474]|uniref:DUF3347 domain-containing protein n=1 Tax=Aquimarina sp. AU474 TaxID=2108529 RepID=UPI00135C2E17|nr:DUF3347 domain-containing protein [Aquimarina sp. AU474]
MRRIFSVLLMIFMLMSISCKKDKKTETVVEEVSDNGIVNYNITDSKSEVKFSDNSTQEIYTQYLKIKGALVNSDHKTVQIESKKLETIVGNNKQLQATSKLISLTKDIKKQRDFFVTLTDEIENLVSKSIIVSGEVYKQFCPMAFEGEGGYWLSDSKEIRNPYFGTKMLKCGNVKEVLKAK